MIKGLPGLKTTLIVKTFAFLKTLTPRAILPAPVLQKIQDVTNGLNRVDRFPILACRDKFDLFYRVDAVIDNPLLLVGYKALINII
jgi:hypothetical protein